MAARTTWTLLTATGVVAMVACVGVAAALSLVAVRDGAVRRAVHDARERFPGDDVEALIAQATAAEAPLDERNRAVWVLGELRDRRALPALRALYVQQACDHERLVCQREVRKAIAKIEGELSPLRTLRRIVERARPAPGG
jgi:hypothetical protein